VSSAAYGRDRQGVEEEIWNRQRQAKTKLLPELPKDPRAVSGAVSGGVSGAVSGGVP